jgi:predicted deacylase
MLAPVREENPRVIGSSVEGRKIEAYSFGDGERTLLFVGGLHGGYEWNSSLLSYMFTDYLEASGGVVPAGFRVVVVPVANPDGLYTVIRKEGRFTSADVPEGDHSAGRFNRNGVDLNRNFDCKWEPTSMWRSKVVSAGTEPFSEPESKALKALVDELHPEAVVFWHSQANAVYASECEDGILPEMKEIMRTYAKAAGYKPVESFDSYSVTGDAEGWLASIGIPAITVELSTHESPEWEKNIKGVEALFTYYAHKAL